MPRRKYGKYLPTLLTLGDLIIVNAVFTLCYLCTRETIDFYGWLRIVFVAINVSFIPSYALFYHIHSRRTLPPERLLWGAVQGVTFAGLIAFFLVSFLAVIGIPNWFYFLLFGCLYVIFPIAWLISKRILKAYRMRGGNIKNVIIIGADENAFRLYCNLKADSGYGMKVHGFFSDCAPMNSTMRVLGPIDDVEDYCKKNEVDEIYYTLPGQDEKRINYIINVADDRMAQFYFVPAISRYVNGKFKLESINSSLPALSLHPSPLQNVFNRGVKRAFDIVFSTIVLIMLGPLVFLPVAIAIKLTSPGPVFFRQKRTGYLGHEFTCFKFRTMRVNADSDSRQASKDDDRKTRIGEFLRRTSIDELPQFFNVLRGDMSVVGPRPHMLLHTETYRGLINRYMVRHLIKPGITGWAQVNGYRGNTDELWKMEKRVECDVWYIEHWSFMLDIRIIYRTITNAIRGEENAY